MLISGGGRTVVNIAEHIARRELDASIEIVIASRSGIKGIERAEALGLRTVIVNRRSFPDTEAFSRAIAEHITEAAVTPDNGLICLAGFLSLLRIPPGFEKRIINIHPALLPKFGGKGMYGDKVHRAVLDAGDTESGCTVHFVDALYDHGPIIAQRRCDVPPGDTVDSLASRVFALECELYPSVIRAFTEDSVRLDKREVRIEGKI